MFNNLNDMEVFVTIGSGGLLRWGHGGPRGMFPKCYEPVGTCIVTQTKTQTPTKTQTYTTTQTKTQTKTGHNPSHHTDDDYNHHCCFVQGLSGGWGRWGRGG